MPTPPHHQPPQAQILLVYWMGGLRPSAAAFFAQYGLLLLAMLVAQVGGRAGGPAQPPLQGAWRLAIAVAVAGSAASRAHPRRPLARLHRPTRPPTHLHPPSHSQSIGLLLGVATMAPKSAQALASVIMMVGGWAGGQSCLPWRSPGLRTPATPKCWLDLCRSTTCPTACSCYQCTQL